MTRAAQKCPPLGCKIKNLDERGYFAGAVNAGIADCKTDVLILNQDVWFTSNGWADLIERHRDEYAIIGDGVMGHPAWPRGYVQGTFMFIHRDALDAVGLFNQRDYPLWGTTAEFQLRACRHGFKALPISNIPGLEHQSRGERQYGDAIALAMRQEPDKRNKFTQTPPAISVIVPCYNYGRYLREAIDSLMAQTFQSFEVIIVDDASVDDSFKVAQSLADDFKAIRAIRNRLNLGTAATINAGIRKSFGRFITVLSADDKYAPDRLERMYRAALANPHSVICDDILWWTEQGQQRKYMGWREEGQGERRYDFDTLLTRNHMHAGIMYSRKAWEEAGGYPEIMRDGREDWAFNVALGRVGYCGVLLDYAGYIVRRQGQNRTLRNTTPRHHEEFLNKLKSLFPDVYRGEYPMRCCGKRGNSPRKNLPALNRTATPVQKSASEVLLKYTGRNPGNLTWYGAETGRRYKFGKNVSHLTGFVAPEDVKQLLETKQFQVIKITPHVAAPKPKPVASVAAIPAQPDIFAPEDVQAPALPIAEAEPVGKTINATDSAIRYANEHSIDLSELELDRKITYRDVVAYAERLGLA